MSRTNSSRSLSTSHAQRVSKAARQNVLQMTHYSGSSHIGSCLSVIDILSCLYAFRISESSQQIEIVLSKGHAAAALYAVLKEENLLGEIDLDDYCKDGSKIYGHVNHLASSVIPLSTGSLGHGMPFAMGMALGQKIKRVPGRIFAIISDGECNEGTTWESALFASHHNLDNLVVVVDRNRIQSLGNTEDILRLEPLDQKWRSFGWSVLRVDGHDHEALIDAISTTAASPVCVIADTIKGKGVSFMEDKLAWHYKSPSKEELKRALCEIEGDLQI